MKERISLANDRICLANDRILSVKIVYTQSRSFTPSQNRILLVKIVKFP